MNLQEHQPYLWGLCYRMTGSAADADDLVQETFKRALEHPPRDQESPLRPWLTKVAVNLSRDALRRRVRAGYDGPWLPSPLDTPEEPVAVEPRSTEGRYELLESVSFAFLLALEALSPKQRAVLLLRDVFDSPVAEVAQTLGISQDNVKTIHLRARKAMAEYDASRVRPTREAQERNRAALEGLLGALLTEDVSQMETLLAADVRAISDGGGQYHAATNVLVGPERVWKFLVGVNKKRPAAIDFEIRMLNGFPALVAHYARTRDPRLAPLVVIRVDVGADGKITAVHSVLADRKLKGGLKGTVPFNAAASAEA
jgi:RNA polymerase sigma-70 factor (ECF subfamily)